MRARLRRAGDRIRGLPPIVYSAPEAGSRVALTFDDGPSEWTAGVARALEASGCRGTFFMRGAAVAALPDVAAAVVAAGHEAGNHLWSHSDPETQSVSELAAELRRTGAAIEEATGKVPTLARPPYCGAPREVARAAKGSVAAIVLRSVDPADWSLEQGAEIADRILAEIGPGDIVCLHDGIPDGSRGTDSRAPTVAAVDRLVPELLARGLEPVTVSELLR